MKKLVMTLLVVVAATTLTTKLSATNPIVSSSLLTIAEPTTFVEVWETNAFLNTNPFCFDPLTQRTMTMGEKKMKVKVDDNTPVSTATAEVEIYSLDGIDVLGPFTVTEGVVLEVDIDNREWGVSTLEVSQGAEISYWVE
ncbi:MAG: hypothetical protein DRI89_01670 [Bacteroidetes bacterium]|nr:MAG: hypothetical protein DRI89_01670 [Bacteroidota bacterium]